MTLQPARHTLVDIARVYGFDIEMQDALDGAALRRLREALPDEADGPRGAGEVKGGLWDTGYDPDIWGPDREVYRGSAEAQLRRAGYYAVRIYILLAVRPARRLVRVFASRLDSQNP